VAHIRGAAVRADAGSVSKATSLLYREQKSYNRAILSVRVEVLRWVG
jgi:hypothetical protein